MRSYKAEVIADASGKWTANGLRFATEDEAQAYALNLWSRWTLVRHYQVVPSADPVNAAWENGRMRYLAS